MFKFAISKKDRDSGARLGRLETAHGGVDTPVFMAVGTQGTVKGMTPRQLSDCGVGMVLGNTYHLMLRPGSERIAQLGGLHRFMAWDGPILTDSGGFQVFSLADLTKRDDRGVTFRSHIDGDLIRLDPERSMKVQRDLGSDVVMAFDDCTPYPADHAATRASMALTHRWADHSLNYFQGGHQSLFGIVQGGMYADLRDASVRELCAKPFAGFAVGGLSVGEPKELMYPILRHTAPQLPEDKPRYLMGVGTPADLVNAVSAGIDMFDCVMPTRNARNGYAFTSEGPVSIKQAAHKDSDLPLDPNCDCYTCTRFTRAYLNHIYRAGEILASVLMTLHNLSFYQNLMANMRRAIAADRFPAFKEQILQVYGARDILDYTLPDNATIEAHARNVEDHPSCG
ncbi:tRNA guanosine(34) transglycosylase Tgt [Acanthopleuribacter pedis]|uniref:tRNA guanosine(34) transglycosylase Tgt n=1 Tax=Acanthopleuribacter pedis TaxID=442870 RepID=UPI001FAE95F0|nr:tRNA guanosine(34) transglycosylase Tgt [Acanthopleuribacter pedis]